MSPNERKAGYAGSINIKDLFADGSEISALFFQGTNEELFANIVILPIGSSTFEPLILGADTASKARIAIDRNRERIRNFSEAELSLALSIAFTPDGKITQEGVRDFPSLVHDVTLAEKLANK